ncbi:hypothetical protein [Aeromonas veronii]
MADQDVDFFDYIDEPNRPPLLNKSYFMETDNTEFKAQRSLEKRLEKIIGIDLSNKIYISRQLYDHKLKEAGVMQNGFKIMKASQ